MKRVALLLGINKYRDPGIQDLQCAGNDAGAVKEMLDENGFETHLLCDEEVILNNVTGKIKEICKQLCAGDLFLFYFSGHGHEIGDNHYLLCHGAIRVTLDINAGGDAVPLAAVRLLSESGCKTGVYRLFVLDCCRSSVLAGTKGGVGFTGRGIELVAENDHGGYIPPVILRSCGAGQQAYEDQKRGHGFFSLALLDAVQQKTVCSFDTFFRSVTNKLREFIHPDQQRATLTDFSGRPLPLFPHWVESHSQPHPQAPPPPTVSDDTKKLLLELLLEAKNLEAKARELGIDLNSNAEYQRNRDIAGLADQRKDWENAASYLAQASQIARPLISEAEARRKAQIWLDARKQGLKFSDDKTVLLECVNKGIQSVVIPEGVTEIGDNAFDGCSSLTSVTIPDGVTKIGESAFDGCSSLTSVTIPESVTEICDLAFSDCNSLTSVTIPESVTEICDWAFDGCSSLTSVTIPESVTKIGESAFADCRSLTSVTIPESVTEICDWAFNGCRSLTSVTIPEGVTKIGEGAFLDCSSLTSVTIPKGVTGICDWAFQDCASLTSVTIPKGVTEIGAGAFSLCASLTSVTIPEGVTYIGGSAFYGCSSLTSVTIPASVNIVGENAFKGVPCLKQLEKKYPHLFPKAEEEARRKAQIWLDARKQGLKFSDDQTVLLGCDNKELQEAVIPEGVTKIGNCAFSDCASLTSVTIPEGVTEIGYCAFSGCKSLTSVTIPEGVTEIGSCVFSGCASLTSVAIPEGVTEICDLAFLGCRSLTSVTIPEGVTKIGGGAFYGCISLTRVTIPEGVTEIGRSAFYGCISLTRVTIPESVTEICDWAFDGCSSLTSVTIPEGVTKIGDNAFLDCHSLTSVDLPGSVESVGKDAFGDTPCEKELRKKYPRFLF